MKVSIDKFRCDGHALCMAVAPDVFDMDDQDELSVVLVSRPEGEMAELARRASAQCPKQAVIIEED